MSSQSWMALVVVTAVLGAVALVGCGGGGGDSGGSGSSSSSSSSSSGGPADTTPPTISSLSADPVAPLTYSGGDVVLRATVTDDGGVAWAKATVTKPDGSTETVDLNAAVVAGLFQKAWTAPLNPTTDDKVYTVRFSAADIANNTAQATETKTITVPGVPKPPDAPAF